MHHTGSQEWVSRPASCHEMFKDTQALLKWKGRRQGVQNNLPQKPLSREQMVMLLWSQPQMSKHGWPHGNAGWHRSKFSSSRLSTHSTCIAAERKETQGISMTLCVKMCVRPWAQDTTFHEGKKCYVYTRVPTYVCISHQAKNNCGGFVMLTQPRITWEKGLNEELSKIRLVCRRLSWLGKTQPESGWP